MTNSCFIIVLLCLSSVTEAALYRWTDEQGNVHYSDQVPSEAVKQERAKLNQQGRVVEVREAAKSPEQLKQERLLKELRDKQEKILAEQRDKDNALLRTFRNENDLQQALQGKLSMLDAQLRVMEANLKRAANQLNDQQKRAADTERQGQPIPKNLLDGMTQNRQQIADHQQKIRELDVTKQDLKLRFTKDLERFRILIAQRDGLLRKFSPQDLVSPPGVVTPEQTALVISAISCIPEANCEQIWQFAKEYVLANVPGQLLIDTDKIIHTQPPNSDQEVGLTVTHINGKPQDTIFMDVRCKQSSAGQELCVGQKVRDLRIGFRPYIESKLAISPSQ